MLKVQWVENGEINKTTVYDSVQDAAKGEDVNLFLNFLVEQGEDIDEIKSELETCDCIEELHAVFKEHFDYNGIALKVAHLDYEVWVSHINRYGCHGPEVSDSWLMLETDDLEEAKTRARDEYKANSDYIVELRSDIGLDYDSYNLVDFKEYDDSIFSVYDFADAEYNEDANTCDLKFYDKTWNITAYIHNVPIPEWMKTEEDGELVYIFDFSDWERSDAIEYALENGVKEIVKTNL